MIKSTSPIRVVLVDDHGVVRDGLKILINAQEDLHVVGEAVDGQMALEMICQIQPDVAVVDISMPVMNGIELAGKLHESNCPTRILVLTANEDRAYMQRALKMGIAGYLFKRSAAGELIQAIRAVAKGGRHLDASVINDLMEGISSPPNESNPSPEERLSEREQEVLKLVALGYSNKEIAAQLDISAKTVDTYKTRSMRKLHLRGRADIVRYAVAQGWLKDVG